MQDAASFGSSHKASLLEYAQDRFEECGRLQDLPIERSFADEKKWLNNFVQRLDPGRMCALMRTCCAVSGWLVHAV